MRTAGFGGDRSPAARDDHQRAFRPDSNELVLTDSETGSVPVATLPAKGAELFSQR